VGEGAGQSASGSAFDVAGNSASAQVSGIDIDKTAPVLTGTASPAPNAAGWNDGDVTVTWECSDALSRLDGDCPADEVLAGEGADVSASASVRDRAGNTADATVAGVKIDRTAPSTMVSVDRPLASGWYAGQVDVVLEATDNLSGVATTFYRVGDGPAQEYDGGFTVAEKGSHKVTFWSVDRAGNVEDRTAPGHELVIKIDGIPPRIDGTASRRPTPSGGTTRTSPSPSCAPTTSRHGPRLGVEGCDPGTTFRNEGKDLAYEGSARDLAGNTASARVSGINIDKTAPTLTGAATTPANAAGWHKGDVTVAWTGEDALSEIDTTRHPADTVVTGEGDALVAGPVTTFDRAGNPSAPASVSPIRIDRTAPEISGAPTTKPNAEGWHRGAVKVAFACTDDLSQCAGTPDDEIIEQDGAGQSVTSGPAEDMAGNTVPGRRVGGINIDSKAPVSSAAKQVRRRERPSAGRHRHDRRDGGRPGRASPACRRSGTPSTAEPSRWPRAPWPSVEIPLAAESGVATLTYRAVDRAGNVELPSTVSLTYDNVSPTVTHTLTPAANAAGWNSAPVTVRFDAKDDLGGSGVDPATLTPDVDVSDETDVAGRSIVGEAADRAGNVGTDKVTVRLDRTAPTITATVTGPQGADGWYTGTVTVRFECTDALSTVANCSKDEVVTTNGSGQSVVGEAQDKAGNRARYEVTGLNIDSTKPTIEMTGVEGRQAVPPGRRARGGLHREGQHLGLRVLFREGQRRHRQRRRLVLLHRHGDGRGGQHGDRVGQLLRHLPLERLPAADQRHGPPGQRHDEHLQGRQHRADEVRAQARRRLPRAGRAPRPCG
jgi:hypothetical protein